MTFYAVIPLRPQASRYFTARRALEAYAISWEQLTALCLTPALNDLTAIHAHGEDSAVWSMDDEDWSDYGREIVGYVADAIGDAMRDHLTTSNQGWSAVEDEVWEQACALAADLIFTGIAYLRRIVGEHMPMHGAPSSVDILRMVGVDVVLEFTYDDGAPANPYLPHRQAANRLINRLGLQHN